MYVCIQIAIVQCKMWYNKLFDTASAKHTLIFFKWGQIRLKY